LYSPVKLRKLVGLLPLVVRITPYGSYVHVHCVAPVDEVRLATEPSGS
jgi:hypothetical protein